MKKKIFVFVMIFCMLLGCLPNAYAAHPFTDVPSGSWYNEAVDYCYTNALMNGTSATQFSPDTTMNRAMLVTVLYRLDGSPNTNAEVPFKDIDTSGYYMNGLRWAYENSIVTGVSATAFAPNNTITREQLVTIFYRYAKYKGCDVSKVAPLTAYSDVGSIGNYAVSAFAWSVGNSIVMGTSSTTLSPQGHATRAQCAVIIQRFINWMDSANESETTDPTEATTPSESTNPTESTAPNGCEHKWRFICYKAPSIDAEPTHEVFKCTVCGVEDIRKIEDSSTDPTEDTGTHEHSYIEYVETPATCSQDGWSRFVCSCGHFFETSTMKSHTFEVTEQVPPTCEDEGYDILTCTVCGATSTDNYVSVVPCSYTTQVVAPTCTELGYTAHTCTGCDRTYNSDWIPALGHSYEVTNLKKSTCIETGYEELTCSVCGDVTENTVPVTSCEYNTQVVAPTCTEQGYTIYTCIYCEGSFKEDYTSSTGHSYEISEHVDPTCTEAGKDVYTCASCDDSYEEEIEILGHDWEYEHTDAVIDYNAALVCTCGWSCYDSDADALGYSSSARMWSFEHNAYYRSIGAVNDHSWSSIRVPSHFVTETPAYDCWTCTRCELSTQDHDDLGHEMLYASKAVTSSCKEGNYSTMRCLDCDYTYKCDDYIESKGHTWGEWVIEREPSDDDRGWATRTCTHEFSNGAVCGYTMGDYADLVNNGQHYHSYKPEYGTVCYICGEDSVNRSGIEVN